MSGYASRTSNSSQRRTNGNGNFNADIDETLFGTQQRAKSATSSSTQNSGQRTMSKNGTAIVSAKLLQQITHNPHVGNTKESVVISGNELYNIAQLTQNGQRGGFSSTQPLSPSSAISSPSSSSSNRNILDPTSRSAARKEKMLRLERESNKNKDLSGSSEFNPAQQEEKENRNRLLGHAKQRMDEEMDDVKHMNQMMLYAQCVTIRDAQILEKQRIQDALLEEEKRVDLSMEINRVRTLKLMSEREKARAEEQRRGASVIIQQIAEREQERIRANEQRDLEAAAMLVRIKELEKKRRRR